jgi:hypothetical protein
MDYIGHVVMFVCLVFIKRVINSAWKITADEGRGSLIWRPHPVLVSGPGVTQLRPCGNEAARGGLYAVFTRPGQSDLMLALKEQEPVFVRQRLADLDKRNQILLFLRGKPVVFKLFGYVRHGN